MDREKIERAAKEAEKNFILDKNTFKNFFKSGADWLMKQPLSERLTDEEKEKIKDLYNSEINSMRVEQDGINNAQSQIEQIYHEVALWRASSIAYMLEEIFGKELFKDK